MVDSFLARRKSASIDRERNPPMSEAATTTAKQAIRNCQCMLGWTGTAGSGSTLAMAENPATVCDRTTRKSFAQGHDARMSSRLATEIATGQTSAEVATKLVQMAGGTAALVSKMLHSAQLRMDKAQKKLATAPTEDDELTAAGAESTASDEGPERSGPGMNTFTDPMAEDDDDEGHGDAFPEEPELPELGAEWSVKHGKRSYKAKVIEVHTGERVASHKLGQGRDCCHDLATGEIVDLSDGADDDTPPF